MWVLQPYVYLGIMVFLLQRPCAQAQSECPGWTKTIKCKSWSQKLRQCPTNIPSPIIQVSIISEYAKSRGCEYYPGPMPLDYPKGEPGIYGFTDEMIWVEGSCKANFEVCFKDECGIGTGIKCHADASCVWGEDGEAVCRCNEGLYGDGLTSCSKLCRCSASGDPHYKTFDGQMIHYQGVCQYTLVDAGTQECGYMTVNVKNKRSPRNSKVSLANKVTVLVRSNLSLGEVKVDEIVIDQGKKLTINGVKYNGGVSRDSFDVIFKGSNVIVKDRCGMEAMFNGEHTVKVFVPQEYLGVGSGICGDCNGLQDDFKMKNGTDVSDFDNKYSLIGQSYYVPDPDDDIEEATPFEDDDDFQLPAAPDRNHEELETTHRTPTASAARQQGSLFRRHLEAGLRAAQAFANGAQVDSLQEELLRALPQLNPSRPPRTPRAGPARPRRQSRLQRAASDRRRNQCVRVRFTALDSPSYRGTSSVNLIALREKGLGREDDKTELLPIAWGPQEIENHIRMKFPSLGETEFDVLIGSRGGRLTEVQELTGLTLKGLVKSHNFARLWVRPKEELRHVTMGTPTVLATARVEVVPPVERLDVNAQLPHLESVSNTSEMLRIPPTSSALPVPGTSRQPDQPQTSAGTISPQPSTSSSLPDLPQTIDPIISVLSDLQPEPVDIPSSPATSTPLSSTPSTPRLVLDVTDEDLEHHLRALRQTQTEAAETITIRRARIVEDVIEVYNNLDLTVRLRVQFVGERGQDLGGLTKDMFSCFWGKTFECYFKGENARVPHLSPSDRHKARDVFPILGKIMEHMLRLLGYLPNMMCRSCLIMMASADNEVDEDLLLEDYLLYLPESEGDLLKQCLNSTSWSDAQNRRLLLFNNAHHMTAIATPANLKQTLLNAAQIELLDTSSAFCRLMFSGLSNAGKNFFRNLNTDSIRMLYSASQATPEKVACLIERVFEEEDLTAMQVVIINYLSALVRGFDSDMLQKFLIWVTGSPSMPDELNISFNSSYGLRRAPVARTCGNLLELSEEYDTYQEFKRELVNVICSDEAMEMTIM